MHFWINATNIIAHNIQKDTLAILYLKCVVLTYDSDKLQLYQVWTHCDVTHWSVDFHFEALS